MEDDERIFFADLAVDRAHVVMLIEESIIPEGEGAEILFALAEIESAGYDALPPAEDVHEAIESAVIDRIGSVGGKMHTARSRNDEVATCIRYRLRSDILAAVEAMIEYRRILLSIAETELETVMPGYTHLQPAQPTTVAHWLCSYERALARDTARFIDAYARVNRSPLGSAAFAGTPFPVDRHKTAELLGFDGVVENATDAISTRDMLVESIAAASTSAVTIAGMSGDIIVFANREFIEIADDYASTSSIMPQKKNPDSLELVRATAGDVIGDLMALLAILKGLPRAYNRDLQRATPHAWRAFDDLIAGIDVVAGAVETIEWHRDALELASGDGFATATGVADQLAMHGVPFRTAHEIVAKAGAAGGDIEAIESAAVAVTGEPLADLVDVEQVEKMLDPVENVRARDSLGGPAPERVAESIDRARSGHEEDQHWFERTTDAVATAVDRLESEVDTYE